MERARELLDGCGAALYVAELDALEAAVGN